MGCGDVTPSSSPPTPPSPLPISVGPGNRKYNFSCSSSPSPPFSPPLSSHTSAENLPFLPQRLASPKRVPSAFSLERPDPDPLDSKSSCLEDLDKRDSIVMEIQVESTQQTPPLVLVELAWTFLSFDW
ncbi:formin-like protein 18 isoform X1 [Populus trichocarpa]|uniref:formin-like protein 18 isoform X1 n=1 Tax=Populus trichocarpa TaxID=3694 RepID=UPI000D1886F9|nr:formin-like protein 18 isoform X1 [Populus trichocarpa]|eukprot:XP_024462531.1 formin-like protein 18 isoform X1 [Populus trichocarpa]